MKRFITGALLSLATLAAATTARADCLLFCGSYAKTKYPLVLVHGAAGFDSIAGVEYFYGIPYALRSAGASVYTPQVAAFNSTEVRGEQLLRQVQDIVAITGKGKVNLIGHSHGSQTSRYVAGVAPQLVASVTSVAGPNRGTPVADLALGVADNALVQAVGGDTVVFAIADAITALWGVVSVGPTQQDTRAALQAQSTRTLAEFNKRFPGGVPTTACGEGASVHNGIRYYSWSGDASSTGQVTTGVDVLDAFFAVTSIAFLGQDNDGLVGTCSSHLGDVIRDDYYQNHADEVNQVVGLVSLFTANPKSLYREHANRLKNAGL